MPPQICNRATKLLLEYLSPAPLSLLKWTLPPVFALSLCPLSSPKGLAVGSPPLIVADIGGVGCHAVILAPACSRLKAWGQWLGEELGL